MKSVGGYAVTAAQMPTVRPRALYLFVLLNLSLIMIACGPDLSLQGKGCLVDWSPDGTRIALVPNCVDDEPEYSGIWMYDSKNAQLLQPIAVTDTQFYLHPRWSPDGNQILIAAVEKEDADSDPIPFSVYVVDPHGADCRRVVDSASTSGRAFLIPNTIMWGAEPDTVIYQRAAGDKVTAMQLDLNSGVSRQYLPDVADLYYLQPSPDRRHVVSVLYEVESQIARVYLSDFETVNWRLLETLVLDSSTVESLSPMIYWAPDSSALVLREKAEEIAGAGRQYLRLFEICSGLSRRICTITGSSAVFWNRDGTALLFSDNNPALGEGICRMDLASGVERMVVPGNQYTLLSWNQEDDRIYLARAASDKKVDPTGDDKVLERRLYYCDGEGKRAGMLGRFYTGNKLSLILSPNGSRMIHFDDTFTPGYLDLTSGDGQPIPLDP